MILLGNAKIQEYQIIALFINVFGCVLAATGGKIDLELFSITGILFGLAAGFCHSMTAILSKIAGDEGNVFTMSTYSYLFATVFLAIYGQPWKEDLITNTSLLLIGLLYAIIPTVVAYLLYYRGVQLIHESSKIPVIASVEMLVAGVLGVFIFNEHLNAINLFGIVLLLFSIMLMNKGRVERR